MLRRMGNNTFISLFVLMIAVLLLASCQRENIEHVEHTPPQQPANVEHEHPHAADVEHEHPHVADVEHAHSQPVATPDKRPQPIVKNLSVIRAYTFDPAKGEKGKISYELTEPARVRIVITEKDDPDQLYRTLLWDWQEAGRQVVEWDGTDESGYLIINRKNCSIRTISIAKSAHRPGTRVIKPLTTEQLVKGLQGPPNHSRCDADKCKAMTVRFVGLLEKGAKGGATNTESSPGPVLSGVVTIEAEAAKDGRGYADKTGYGVRWMVDEQLVAAHYYEKECDGKFSYPLDTSAFRNGEHVVRVSTCDHYDHTGVAGTKVVFDNK
jgi:hypothetical protein